MFCAPALASGSSSASLEPWTGGPKPGFELDSLDRLKISLDDQRGRATIVHFFATWCAPCIDELRTLEKLAARRHGKDVTILAVNVGEVDARVRSFFARQPVSFPVLFDRDRATTKAWQVMALPTSFVLEPGLSPVLFVEGDVDWSTAEIDSALDRAARGAEHSSASDAEKGEER